MNVSIFFIGLVVIVRGNNAADDLQKIEEDLRVLKDLNDKFNQYINEAQNMHPILSSINKELEDLKQKPINAAHCWWPMQNAIDAFSRNLKREIPSIIETNLLLIEDRLKHSSSRLDEVEELLSTTTSTLNHSLREFMKKNRSTEFKMEVLSPIIDCMTKSQPLDWLTSHFGGLVRSVLL